MDQIGRTFLDIANLPWPIAFGGLVGCVVGLAVIQALVVTAAKMIFREAIERHKIIEAAALGVALASFLYTAYVQVSLSARVADLEAKLSKVIAPK